MAPKVSEVYKQQKKNEIIQAAAIIFGEKGYFPTTMDDLVKASGMSKGAIYHYFKSKEEVYEYMLQQQVEYKINNLMDKFSVLKTTKEKVIVLFDTYSSAEWLKQPKINSVRNQLEHWMAGSRTDNRKKYEEHSEIFYNFLKDILIEGQTNGEISMEINTLYAAKLFWSMIDGILLHGTVLEDSFSYVEVVSMAKEMYITFLTRGV